MMADFAKDITCPKVIFNLYITLNIYERQTIDNKPLGLSIKNC